MIKKRDKKTEQIIQKILNLGFFDYDYYLDNKNDLRIYDITRKLDNRTNSRNIQVCEFKKFIIGI